MAADSGQIVDRLVGLDRLREDSQVLGSLINEDGAVTHTAASMEIRAFRSVDETLADGAR